MCPVWDPSDVCCDRDGPGYNASQQRHAHREDEFIDELDGAAVYKAVNVYVRQLDAAASIVTFFGWLFLMCAILCYYRHSDDEYREMYPYILSEILVGILLPIFLFCFAAVHSVVISYVTYGKMDMRSAVSKFIPVVQFQRGTKYDYWSIVDFFYFPQNKKSSEDREVTIWSARDKNRHTWCFATLVSLQLLLAISYFVDVNIAEQITVKSCGNVDSGMYQCFEHGSFNFVDCNDTNSSKALSCFRFLKFGKDISVIGSLSQSFAFAMVTAVFFGHTFGFIKLLNHVKQSRWWGLIIVAVSFALFVIAVLVLFKGNVLLPRVEVITTLQCIMIAAFILIAGILALEGKWWEKVPPSQCPRPIQLQQQNEEGGLERMSDVPQ
eukprot:Em0012g956a